MTIEHSELDATPSHSPVVSTGPRRRTRMWFAGLCVAILGSLGLSAVNSSAPASAAGGVSYCFRHTNGSPYTYDAYLQLYSGGRWVTMKDMGRSVNGCNSFTILGSWRNYPARMLAYTRVGTVTFSGTTPYYAPAGSLTYSLGTGLVNS